eukprot:TRINITY_DN799_c0_g1_i8.p1 TRINITY_DN799_c0_g1~~TRINITY_DN799_c0_g1_i8.p1  ORF type:complete len:1129 (-),score=223.76 TRINITY_DN799_c0_g1_i8:509-3541(-)
MSYFKLSRCAVLIPSPDEPGSWVAACERGFLKGQDRTVYRRGAGLTGRTLGCNHPTEMIVSSSVTDDHRWSKRYGVEFQRNEIEQCAGTSIAFIGIPFFSRVREGERRAYGAIIAMRPHDPQFGYPGPFSTQEKRILQLAVTAAAHGFDTLRWRESLIDAASWQLKIAELWGTDLPDEVVFRSLLRILHSHLFRGRLLIAVRHADRVQISGKAVFGGFKTRLVEETVRCIFPAAPAKDIDEDILSRVCRLRISAPFPVDANSTDPSAKDWARFLHKETRIRHGVEQPLVVIPIPDRDGAIQAVILAESAVGYPIINDRLRELQGFARHSATLIEFLRVDAENRRRRRLVRLMNDLTVHLLEPGVDEFAVLRQVLAVICSEFLFPQSVLYRFDQNSSALEGVLGLGVDGNEVRRTVYSVKPSGRTTTSFALHVFHTRQALFIESMNSQIVDHDDRDRVGIADTSAGFGVPLIHHDRVEGVLIVCWTPATAPAAPLTDACTRSLRVLASFLGLVLAVQRRLRDLALPERANSAKDLILEQVGRLAASLQRQISRGPNSTIVAALSNPTRDLMSAIVKEVAAVFQAEYAGIFLSERPVVLQPRDVHPQSAGSVWESEASVKRFRLVTGFGYDPKYFEPSDECISYSPSEPGLTSLVLRTLQPRMSNDVARDPQWSQKASAAISCDPKALRTWLGVPLMFTEHDKVYLFGALSCTRLRRFDGDSREFTNAEANVALSIANLISLALYSLELVDRERRGMDQFLTLFKHEDLFAVFDGAKTHADFIELLTKTKTAKTLPIGEIRSRTEAIQRTVRIVSLIVDAYSAYARRADLKECAWSLVRQIPLTRVVDDVITFCRAIGSSRKIDVTVDPWPLPKNWDRAAIDESKTAYILYAFVRNAIKSIDHAKRTDGRIELRIETIGDTPDDVSAQTPRSWIRVTVKDNGRGIDPGTAGRTFDRGYSEFGGSGLGLAIVKYFLDSVTATSESVVQVDGVFGHWASFTALIPVVFHSGGTK